MLWVSLPAALAFRLGNNVGLGNVAHAGPPFDSAIDVQLFEMSPGARSFMSVADGNIEEKKQYSLDLLLTFLTDPFVIYNVNNEEEEIIDTRTDVVSSMFAGQLTGAYGLTKDLQLGVSLPLVFAMRGDGLNPDSGDMETGGLKATGLGDLRLQAKIQFLRKSSIQAAWIAGITVPTSFGTGGNDYLGDDLPSAHGGFAAHLDAANGLVRLGANVGVILRKPRQIYASEVGQQVTFGAGATVHVTDGFSLIGEAFGRTALTSLALDTSPVEVGGGMRVQATESFSVLAGGGIGVLSGIGSPALRFVVSVGYAPDLGDSDGDGIANLRDLCPLLEEDFDGFEDSDGCPENDNDGDRREDSVDACPNDKEDLDGFEDEDGCPEPDNDNDGILDAQDRCPIDAEDGRSPYSKDGCPADKRDSDDDGVSDLHDRCPDDYEDADGFEDWDGCPELDNDFDGIADEDDACPLCPEDIDGFEDTDGCPDLDNDNDGVNDQADSCPAEAETLNGINDGDGCPDRGALVANLEGNRLVLSKTPRFTRDNRVRNHEDMQTVSRIMHMQRDVRLWRVVVAAKQQGSDEESRAKSQAQADSLREILVSGGLSPERVEAVGAVSANPVVAIAAVERGELDDSFVCPASMEVMGRTRPDAEASTSKVAVPVVAAAVVAAPPVAAPPASIKAELPAQMQGGQGVDAALRMKRGKAAFAGRTTRRLDAIANMLTNNPGTRLEVIVHTDARGGSDKALATSVAQAKFIVDYLVHKKIDKSRLSAVGKGMSEPLGDNKSSAGREKNRRVELRFML